MLKILLLPFGILWWFIFLLFKVLGNLLFSLVLIGIGAILTATIIGAVVGIPFIIMGVLLLIRSIF